MERIQALIDKLYQQKQLNSNPAQLLLTVQMLQAELLKLQQKNGSIATGKVAVTLPVNTLYNKEIITARDKSTDAPSPVAPEQPQQIVQPDPPPPVVEEKRPEIPEPVISEPVIRVPLETYELKRPALIEEVKENVVVESFKEEPISAYAPRPFNPAFDTPVESPTLTQHQPKKELHELISEQKESLNDRLKQDKTELAQVLKETPIKDLRKGIGINDRFTFVNELFRGDTAMYERSIKTINNFHIYSEAEYWITRELKYKLGWDDTKETVQHFYNLVRRRFS